MHGKLDDYFHKGLYLICGTLRLPLNTYDHVEPRLQTGKG